MGDTGSMAIGGALAGFAIMTKTELLLLLIGGIFLIEALSVIIQVVHFKYLGRRVFLMAPIHHHFEMKAWSETKIMVRFWILTAILCALRLRALLPLLLPVLPGRMSDASCSTATLVGDALAASGGRGDDRDRSVRRPARGARASVP